MSRPAHHRSCLHRSCLKAALAAAFCVFLAPPVGARPAPESQPPKKTQPLTLDDLYARLKAAGDDAEAKGVSRLIEQRLGRSGSATADLLTERARQAMSGQDLPLAIELMDRATTLEPGWSEGWNRRATVFWMLSDPSAAIADLQRTLVLEPRHYEAWAALGRIYQTLDDKRRALEAFRRAAALYPRMDRLQQAIDRLAPDVDGRDL
jgi:tetratricopeptide (TPR) repeat protein